MSTIIRFSKHDFLETSSLCDKSTGVAESESSTTPNTKPRGGKLARRARSFKEDFLEILSQMRSPGGGGAQRSGSPHSPKTRTGHKVASIDTVDGSTEKNPLRDLDLHVKQVTNRQSYSCLSMYLYIVSS